MCRMSAEVKICFLIKFDVQAYVFYENYKNIVIISRQTLRFREVDGVEYHQLAHQCLIGVMYVNLLEQLNLTFFCLNDNGYPKLHSGKSGLLVYYRV